MSQAKYDATMRLLFFSLIFAAAIVVIAMLTDSSASADGKTAESQWDSVKRVLVLNSHDQGMPWQHIVNQSIHSTFESDTSVKKKLYTEYTGLSHRFDDVYVSKLVDLYSHKYSHLKMDLIIAVGIAATNFINAHEGSIFPGVPLVYLAGKKNIKSMRLRPNMIGLAGDSTIDVKGTLDLVLKLHPGTQNIAVISGASETDHLREAEVRNILQDYKGRLRLIELTGLPMDELLTRVSRLPQNTIALYVLTLVDGAGEAFIPKKILPKISQASNVPMYGLWDTLIGSGIVGGNLASAELEGIRAAEVGLRILNGEKADTISFAAGFNKYIFDWQQLQRWGIRENDLPADSTIHNRKLSAWDLYKWHIIGISSIAMIEGLLILFLMIQSRMRRKAELLLQKAHDELEIRVENRTVALSQANEQLHMEVAERKKAEAALHEAVLRQEEAVKATNIGLWDWHLDTDKVNYSSEWKSQIGYDEHEISDEFEEWKRRVHPDDLEPLLEQVQQCISERRQAFQTEFRFRHKNGSYRWILAQASVLQDESGRPVRLIGSHVDVTERKRLEDQQRLQSQIMDQIHDSVTATDMDGIITSWNKGSEILFQYTAGEVVGKEVSILYPEYSHAHLRDSIIPTLLSRGNHEYQTTLVRKDGNEFEALVSLSVLRNNAGKTVGMIGYTLDITDREKAQKALADSERRLSDIIEFLPNPTWVILA